MKCGYKFELERGKASKIRKGSEEGGYDDDLVKEKDDMDLMS